MRFLILIPLLFIGCYTRKGCEKFCVTDTIETKIRIVDTTIINQIKVDTFFKSNIDTFEIVKDKIKLKYVKIHDSIFISGTYLGDTIYKDKLVYVKIPWSEIKQPKTWLKKASEYLINWFAILGVLLALIYILRKIFKF